MNSSTSKEAVINSKVIKIYNERAKRYDVSTLILYNLLGMRVNRHRKLAVKKLNLKKGDTVVEIGCGTGGNFLYLEEQVSGNGKIIGVDLTPAMLVEAESRVKENGWKNVELLQSGGESFEFPKNVDAIISTFALTMIPEYDRVICDGADALKQGGKWVVMDFRAPQNWLKRFVPLLVTLVKPYGGTIEMADRHPWESMGKYMSNVVVKGFWFGMAYIAEATKR